MKTPRLMAKSESLHAEEKMNILLTIHHHLDPNAGASGITLKLGQEYQKADHRVSYFSFDNLPSKLPEIIKAIIFPYWLTAHLIFQKQPIDVIDASTNNGCSQLQPSGFTRFTQSSSD